MREALLTASSPDLFITDDEQRALRDFGGARCGSGASAATATIIACLRSARVDLVVEAGLKAYDILPLMPIIERAGGIVTTWDGGDAKRRRPHSRRRRRRLHEAALKVLSR